MCNHNSFIVEAKVNRLTASDEDTRVVAFSMELECFCAECMQPFKFVGIPVGHSPFEPSTNVEGTEARIPIIPYSANPELGNIYEKT